jgi:hypothetical protein
MKRALESLKRFNIYRSLKIPEPPTNFTPQIDGVPLLVCRTTSEDRTVNLVWNGIPSLTDFVRKPSIALRANYTMFTSIYGVSEPEVYWVEFNPDAYQGMSPDEVAGIELKEGARLAGTEVLWAAALFPRWIESWAYPLRHPKPNMSGLRYFNRVPYLSGHDRIINIGANGSEGSRWNWASPVVRRL